MPQFGENWAARLEATRYQSKIKSVGHEFPTHTSLFAGEGARATFSTRALLCLVDLRRRQSLGGQHRGLPILGILVAGRIFG